MQLLQQLSFFLSLLIRVILCSKQQDIGWIDVPLTKDISERWTRGRVECYTADTNSGQYLFPRIHKRQVASDTFGALERTTRVSYRADDKSISRLNALYWLYKSKQTNLRIFRQRSIIVRGI